jgi:hypothetical protein
MAASVTAGRALRYAGGSARGRLLHPPAGHCRHQRARRAAAQNQPRGRAVLMRLGGGKGQADDDLRVEPRQIEVFHAERGEFRTPPPARAPSRLQQRTIAQARIARPCGRKQRVEILRGDGPGEVLKLLEIRLGCCPAGR